MKLQQKYPLIVDYGYRLGSNRSFIEEELKRAEQINAPRDVWSFRYEDGEPTLARNLPAYSDMKNAWMKRDDWAELTEGEDA